MYTLKIQFSGRTNNGSCRRGVVANLPCHRLLDHHPHADNYCCGCWDDDHHHASATVTLQGAVRMDWGMSRRTNTATVAGTVVAGNPVGSSVAGTVGVVGRIAVGEEEHMPRSAAGVDTADCGGSCVRRQGSGAGGCCMSRLKGCRSRLSADHGIRDQRHR